MAKRECKIIGGTVVENQLPTVIIIIIIICLFGQFYFRPYYILVCYVVAKKSPLSRILFCRNNLFAHVRGRIFCRHNCYIYCDTNCQIVNLVILYFSVSDSRRNRLIGSNSQRFICYFIFIIII